MATSSRTVDVHPQMVQGSKWVYVGDVLGVGKHLRNLSQLVGSLSKRDGRRLPCASVRVLEPHPGEQRGDVVSQADWRSWKYETRTITRHIATPPLRLRNGPSACKILRAASRSRPVTHSPLTSGCERQATPSFSSLSPWWTPP